MIRLLILIPVLLVASTYASTVYKSLHEVSVAIDRASSI